MGENGSSENIFKKIAGGAVKVGTAAAVGASLTGSAAGPEILNKSTPDKQPPSKPPIVLNQPTRPAHPTHEVVYPTPTATPEATPEKTGTQIIEEVLGSGYERVDLAGAPFSGKHHPESLDKLKEVMGPESSAFTTWIELENIENPVDPQYSSTFWVDGEPRPIVKPGAEVQKNGPITYGDADSFQGMGANIWENMFLGIGKDGTKAIVFYPDNATFVHDEKTMELDFERSFLPDSYDLTIKTFSGKTQHHIKNPHQDKGLPVIILLGKDTKEVSDPNVIKAGTNYNNILGIDYQLNISQGNRKIIFHNGKGQMQ